MSDMEIQAAIANAQSCLGVAQQRGYSIGKPLAAAITLLRDVRSVRLNEVTPAPVTNEVLAKIKPAEIAARVRQESLDRLADRESTTVIQEWRHTAAIACARAIQTEMTATWLTALAEEFDNAVVELRTRAIQVPDPLRRQHPDQLDADSLVTWGQARQAVGDVENLLGIRALFASLLNEQPASAYGHETAMALSLAAPPADLTVFEDVWRERHIALRDAADDDAAARWVTWLKAERMGWATIRLATDDLAQRVQAADTFASLGNALQAGGNHLAERLGQVAGWHMAGAPA